MRQVQRFLAMSKGAQALYARLFVRKGECAGAVRAYTCVAGVVSLPPPLVL